MMRLRHRAKLVAMEALSSAAVAARHGDRDAFTSLVAPIRPALHAHCYRMLGSIEDADDATQDTLLRAWRGLGAFEGRSSVRTWLFTIATRVCLDMSASRGRRALPMDLSPASSHVMLDSAPATETRWLTPYPESDPGDQAQRREALELAFVAALQHLPGNQRAALLLFDVLDFSAGEIAEMMMTTTTSVNSALSRARRSLVASRDGAGHATDGPFDARAARRLARRFATALEEGDIDAFVSLLTSDVTWTMPPLTTWYRGIDAVADFASRVPMALCPSWRHTLLTANGAPAVAFYLGQEASGPHDAWAIAAFSFRGDRISAITSFLDPGLFARFGLAERVD
jgi:RNA polymerase sigma-70 factor (ECF subfamily)